MVWLPPGIPANVRLILSTLPGRPLDDLKKRGWPTLQVEPLELKERRRLIMEYLAQYTKALSPDRVERLATARQTANPLYLRALLEELRVYGDYFTLPQRIDHYLAASTVEDLYEKILERYEQDYERERPSLVRDVMTLLWAARRGLSEAELLDLLGSNGEPLPQAYWSPLYLAAEQSLVSRSGLIGFFHNYLRQAVQDRYLPTERDQQAIHLHLADFFQARDLGPRKVDELPWQLAQVKSWQRLATLLADLSFFSAAWDADHFQVKAYWAQVEASSPLQMLAAYGPVLDAPERHTDYAWNISILLAETGHLREALSLRQYFVEHYRRRGSRANLQGALADQANILIHLGEVDAALALLKEQERICRELGHRHGLQGSFFNQAGALQARGDLDGAMTLYKEQERICREVKDKHWLSLSLGGQAIIFMSRAEWSGAMALYKEQERICRDLGDRDGLANCLGNQANVLANWNNLDGAIALLREAERICREVGDKGGLVYHLARQANILTARGNLDGAMALVREAERICREVGESRALEGLLGIRAHILFARGDLDGAMASYKEQECLCRESRNPEGLVSCLASQAVILAQGKRWSWKWRRRPRAALALAEEAYRLTASHGLTFLAKEVRRFLDYLQGRGYPNPF